MARSNFQAGDQTLLRQINLSAILQHLRAGAPISRSELAEVTGLNKTTVSSLVRELIERQFVHELHSHGMGVGRPRVLLELNPAAGVIISAEIGVDFISVVRANFAAEILWRTQESTRPDMGQQVIIDRLLALLAQAIGSNGTPPGNLLGIAVGVPGLVDQADGTLLFAPNLGWRDVPLCALLRPHLEGPVFFDNEANLAALGEYYFGAARGYDEVLYISAGVGLGGGIVRAGHLFKGSTGYAGEFGHMTMDPQGQRCNCGNRGCWETQVSQSALFRYVRDSLGRGQPSVLPDLLGGDLDRLTVAAVVDAARAGDAVALEALDRIGHYLGIGIASLVNALNPGLVVFGGILSLAGDYLLPAVQEELQERALRWNEQANRVVPARYSFDACVMGGIAAVYHAILTQPGNLARQGLRRPAYQAQPA